MTVLCQEDCCGYDADEDNGGKDTMPSDESVVLGQAFEAVSHAIVLHRCEVQADQVGEQVAVSLPVPGAIAGVKCVARVRAAPHRGEVTVRHCGVDAGGPSRLDEVLRNALVRSRCAILRS